MAHRSRWPYLIKRYSNELNVTARTPPAFLVHAADDAAVPVGNSMRFGEALHAQHVAVELIVYPSGGHGFGLNNPGQSRMCHGVPHACYHVADGTALEVLDRWERFCGW